MKRVQQLLFLAAILGFISCSRQNYLVGSAYHKANDEDEVKYDSFTCIESDSILSYEPVISEISSQMKLRGYANLADKPQIIVFYALFPNEVNLSVLRRTFRGFGKEEFNEELDRIRLKRGTLLIQFIENETNRPIWMGYASGLANKHAIDEKTLHQATRTILDNYRVFAVGYINKVKRRKL
ncbi:protein of unknown function [Pseudarcicella hirudinis]|uniref:DUF4136 domain-containing protein n=1 Tax=Pseudarcicella hirudinis TaxID=1079859 RepID=A0A1I5WRN0_9BACT|nr:DUF4136 domain-containing protein [Pseudarcicella hirudinis]SFQ22076.1 protein of unknown function [Pseudarcicella hirudinis]